MKKAETTDSGVIGVAVTRLGADPVPVTLPVGSTVADALAKAGVSAAGNTEYFVSGQRAEKNDVLEDKDVLALVTPKQAGSK
jgi:hypothetical protein